uniref:Putative ovule protein n=1 Tax=Solanum chacoense TaxID=4108 RepID=A0A0V0HFS9_SOLCH
MFEQTSFTGAVHYFPNALSHPFSQYPLPTTVLLGVYCPPISPLYTHFSPILLKGYQHVGYIP